MSSSSTEVEIKFAISDLGALNHRLKSAGLRLCTPRTHEFNTLYDTTDQTLRRRGELLRIRKYGSTWTLTHKAKGSIGRHKSRIETETKVSDGEKLANIVEALGLKPGFRYEKFRTEWEDDTGKVVIDETPIGCVGEIEGPPAWIDAMAKKLGLAEADYCTKSYGDLFLEWKQKTGSRAEEMTWKSIGEPKV